MSVFINGGWNAAGAAMTVEYPVAAGDEHETDISMAMGYPPAATAGGYAYDIPMAMGYPVTAAGGGHENDISMAMGYPVAATGGGHENDISMTMGYHFAAAAPNQPSLATHILTLPLHIREAIYREVLGVENTIKHYIHEDWDTAEIIDDMTNSDTPTDWVWSMCPRTTRYNFDTSLLFVNRQVHAEAAHVLGRHNTWVLVRIGDRLLAQDMEEVGCAIPIPDSWTLAGINNGTGGSNRIAIDISVGGAANMYAAQQQIFLMSVQGIWDLVAHLLSYCMTPWCIVIRFNYENIYPRSQARDLEGRVLKTFMPLRILRSTDPGVNLVVESGWPHLGGRALHIMKTPLHIHQVLKMLRNHLAPFNLDVDKVDWAHEELKMAEWSFIYTNAISRYGADAAVGKIWRDTICMAHARLMVIKLGLGALEEAQFHARRADFMLEMHEARLWWYQAVVSNMNIWSETLSKPVTEEILDIIWCLSQNEDKQWFNLFWLHGKDNEEFQRNVVLTVAHKIEAARCMTRNRPVNAERRAKAFGHLMMLQGQKLVASFDPGVMDEYNLSMQALLVSNNLPDSLQSYCYKYGFLFWSLV
ncbi:hypothetical protein FQN49_000900 [Arthroderma sp. PD_2]|nr:hypothetical protein FQN49_000900 [Arthroderma sp. PD_2]